MPFGLQPIHIIAVVVVALLIFGPSKLPELGRSVGRSITEFRKGAKEMSGSFMDEINQPVDAVPPVSPAVSSATASPAPASDTVVAGSPVTPSNFCIHCGKANPAGAVFCNQCGSKISE